MNKLSGFMRNLALASLSLTALMGCQDNSERPAANISPFSAATLTAAPNPAQKIPVKFVVVTMFEIGEDAGDTAGEYQLWKARENLTTCYEIRRAYHEVCMNDKGVMGIVTGIGTAWSTASVMAIGTDTRFDFSKAYWMVAGIAGINPNKASVGSAVWSEWLVDGDLSHEIDAREIPADWDTGYIARHTKRPYDIENKPDVDAAQTGEVYRLDTELTHWAFGLTQHTELQDNAALAHIREKFVGFPLAQQKPFVAKGEHIAALTFWHGKLMSQWASNWVNYWTDGQGEYYTSAMEETGTYLSLKLLTRDGLADVSRMLVLRTGSNFDQQPPGMTAAESLAAENEGYSGLEASVENAHRVGSKVLHEIINNWDVYQDRKPTTLDL